MNAIDVRIDPPGVALGLVHASVTNGAVPQALARAIDDALAHLDASEDEPVRQAVRDLLRHGKYKPTGRGKPASEYLRQAAREGRFPRIDALVDANNLVSLVSGLPISVLDVERAGTCNFICRHGRVDERYVFNAAGHTIELQDLLLIAADGEPCANAVRDSMRTKVDASTGEILAVIYAPAPLSERASQAARRFAEIVKEFGQIHRAWTITG